MKTRVRSSPQTGSNFLAQSFGAHASLFVLFLIVYYLTSKSNVLVQKIKFEIKEVATAEPSLKIENLPPPQTKTSPRKVFGLSKNSLQSEKSNSVEVKAGNTLAKAIDQEKMRPEDESSLPVPAEEYLVSQMPRLKSDVRIPYPPEARSKNIEGVVLMDILIDSSGKVRDVKLIEGPGYGLNEAALAVIPSFQFEPAMIDNKPVAVRIRYAYRFVLN